MCTTNEERIIDSLEYEVHSNGSNISTFFTIATLLDWLAVRPKIFLHPWISGLGVLHCTVYWISSAFKKAGATKKLRFKMDEIQIFENLPSAQNEVVDIESDLIGIVTFRLISEIIYSRKPPSNNSNSRSFSQFIFCDVTRWTRRCDGSIDYSIRSTS